MPSIVHPLFCIIKEDIYIEIQKTRVWPRADPPPLRRSVSARDTYSKTGTWKTESSVSSVFGSEGWGRGKHANTEHEKVNKLLNCAYATARVLFILFYAPANGRRLFQSLSLAKRVFFYGGPGESRSHGFAFDKLIIIITTTTATTATVITVKTISDKFRPAVGKLN